MHLWKSRMNVWPNWKGQNCTVKKWTESHNTALFFHFFTAIKVALSWHFVSMWKQNRPKMIKSDNKSFILWPFCILPLYKCVFFPNLSVTYATFLLNCLKVGRLYFRHQTKPATSLVQHVEYEPDLLTHAREKMGVKISMNFWTPCR